MSRWHPDADALQARVAARLVGVLSADDRPLPPDAQERLRFARQAALERARQARVRTASVPLHAQAGELAYATAGRGGLAGWSPGVPVSLWQRMAALLPLLVLAVGLVGIENWATQEQIVVAADIDAALLSDDLPPEAYADPGFAEFLIDEPAASVLVGTAP